VLDVGVEDAIEVEDAGDSTESAGDAETAGDAWSWLDSGVEQPAAIAKNKTGIEQFRPNCRDSMVWRNVDEYKSIERVLSFTNFEVSVDRGIPWNLEPKASGFNSS